MALKRKLSWFVDKLLNLFLIGCGLVALWVLLQVTCIATFRIPSDSMEPAFNIWDAAEGKEVRIFRLPGLGEIKRNDVLVFNFPYPARWDSIGLNLMTYYVKRCVALPGDTFEISQAHYKVCGCNMPLGNVDSQDGLRRIIENGRERDWRIVMSGYPYNELVKEYFCTDGKDIDNSGVYDDNDPYANREIRLYASIFLPPLGSYPGTKYNDITYNCFQGPNTADSYNRFPLFNGYCPKKGCDPSITNNLGSTPTYTPLMRYAEVLLSYLEALNESNPGAVDQTVLDLTINDIRNRVKLPGYQKGDLPTQEDVRKVVRKERRVELAFEGFRYFDVLRWGIAEQELNHTFTGVKLSDDPSAPNYRGSGSAASPVDQNMYYQFEKRTWAAHNRYFPIPQSERNVNKNLEQNEGYN